MSLFEYDQGHLIPAQFGHPVGPEAQGEILDSVRRQVLEVIARPLFPVTWNDMTVSPVSGMPGEFAEPGVSQGSGVPGADGTDSGFPQESPRLTALDGSGQVVLVEVVNRLDSSSLIASLARLGAVSNLGWNDLAAAYPGGVSAFRSGWTQFRDAMPPNLAAGPRLILVATEIDPDVRPALDALTPSGLEVHHVSVREMSNGRRFLDVQRVASSLFSHDTNLLAGRGARIPAITSSADADMQNAESVVPEAAPSSEEVPSVGFADLATPMASAPVSEAAAPDNVTAGPAPAVPAPAPAATPEPAVSGLETAAESPAPVDEPALQTGSISRHSIMEAARSSSVSPLAAGEDEEPVESLFTTHHGSVAEKDAPSFADIISGVDAEEPQPPHHSHRAAASEQTLEAEAQAQAENEPAQPEEPAQFEQPEEPGEPEQMEQPAEFAGAASVGTETWGTPETPEVTETAEAVEISEVPGADQPEASDLLNRDAAGLGVIAQVTGEDTPLIALVNFDGSATQVSATLAERGVIILEGREFDNPTEAARVLGQEVDGWEFWHLGFIDGPTLAEAQAEINAEIERNR
ncbi:cell surface protein [uncultured Mobiluncus sp.]|uniref:cell surface protein n=1 Tax=uncultured Mobiluncus sp. TaxID=293425 RepID=UPI00288B8A3B|nr:cell surface protein [uncultured Mobiluncus sp.]